MVDVWAVVGDAHMHKTSTIRALTGVGRVEPNWNVAFAAGPAATYVHPPGLQEIGVAPAQFIADVTGAGVGHVIVALRYAAARGHPDAAGYLTAFQQAGWHVEHAVLGPRPPVPGFPGGTPIPNAPQLPSNDIARQLRAAWNIA